MSLILHVLHKASCKFFSDQAQLLQMQLTQRTVCHVPSSSSGRGRAGIAAQLDKPSTQKSDVRNRWLDVLALLPAGTLDCCRSG